MNRKASLWLAVALGAGALAALAQQNFADVEIRPTRVSDGLYMLEGRGGNIGVLTGADGTLLIDTQFAPLAEKIEATVKELGDAALRFVLNTHVHGDHTGGNAHFGKLAPILAHQNVRGRLASQDGGDDRLPVLTYENGISLFLNGQTIEVVHFPRGHTDGDSVVFFKDANVVHTGDHFFSGRFPFIDTSSGGSVEGFRANVEKLLGMVDEETKIIPGHGPLSTPADLRTFRDMMNETIATIASYRKDGLSVEQAKSRGLPAKWESWGSGFINTQRWIEIVYGSLE
jgi:glyoxylase-like metal-dependent hydrolase (beta-lactamase superfamily II)